MADSSRGNIPQRLFLPAILILALFLHIAAAFFLYDFQSDEGNWLVNAKNLVLFHTQSLDGMYFTALSPLNTFLHAGVFRVLPISIMTGRGVSILFALAALALFFVFLKRSFSAKAAAIACLLVAVDSFFTFYTSLASLEAKVYFFALLSVLCVFSHRRRVRLAAFVPFALCLGFKPNAVFLAIPLAAALYMRARESGEGKQAAVDIARFVSGTALCAAAIFLPAYLMDPADFVRWGMEMHMQGRFVPLSVLRDPLHNGMLPGLFYLARSAPVTLLAGCWGVWQTLRRKRSPAEDFLLLWLAAQLCFYAFQAYVPERYLLGLLFPLTALFAASAANKKTAFIAAICALIAVSQIAVTFYRPLAHEAGRPRMAAARWVEQNAHRYATVRCPALLGIAFPGPTVQRDLPDLLRDRETRYPLLFADDHAHDRLCGEYKGALVTTIGEARFYSFPSLE